MKNHLLLILSLISLLILSACAASGSAAPEPVTFQATLLEIHDGSYLVEPVEGSAELNSADRITVPIKNTSPSPEPEIGDTLEIEYDGSIAESYPAQITAVYHIRVVEP